MPPPPTLTVAPLTRALMALVEELYQMSPLTSVVGSPATLPGLNPAVPARSGLKVCLTPAVQVLLTPSCASPASAGPWPDVALHCPVGVVASCSTSMYDHCPVTLLEPPPTPFIWSAALAVSVQALTLLSVLTMRQWPCVAVAAVGSVAVTTPALALHPMMGPSVVLSVCVTGPVRVVCRCSQPVIAVVESVIPEELLAVVAPVATTTCPETALEMPPPPPAPSATVAPLMRALSTLPVELYQRSPLTRVEGSAV